MRRFTSVLQIVTLGISMICGSLFLDAKKMPFPITPPSPPKTTPQINVHVGLGNPILLEGKNQKTYLKVDLEGVPMETVATRTPINIALVIDRSGSMEGDKIKNAKKAAIMALLHFDKNDIISVIAYDDDAEIIVPATKVFNKDSIIEKINKIQASGSTALFAGVSKGAQEIRKFIDKNKVNRIILLSDGDANVGPSSPSELGDLGISLGKEGISVTTLGLGLGYNEDLMTQLALKSDGNHAFVKEPNELTSIFHHEFGDVLSVVAQNVKVTIDFQNGIKPVQVLGREATIYGNKVVSTLRQVYSKQEKYLLIEVEVETQASGKNQPTALISMTYDNMTSRRTDSFQTQISPTFSRDKNLVERSINKKIMAAAIEQQGAINTEKAIQLRDTGNVAEAKKILQSNQRLMIENAKRFDSPTLEQLGDRSTKSLQMLDEKHWNENRKQLKGLQQKTMNQQSY